MKLNGSPFGPTHAWLRDPTSGIVHLVRAKDGHACCAEQRVKRKPSATRWAAEIFPDPERRCTTCQRWLAYYVGLQQKHRNPWAM